MIGPEQSSGWDNRDWQRGPSKPPSSSPPSQSSVPNGTVSLPSSFEFGAQQEILSPFFGETVSTIKSNVPTPATTTAQSAESAELAKAKRKLEEAGIALTPEKKQRQAQGGPSTPGPSLPTTAGKTPAEKLLSEELSQQPATVPSSVTKDAVSQFRGKANTFKEHAADVVSILQSSEATKQDPAETATRYGLQKQHAGGMPFANLSTFMFWCLSVRGCLTSNRSQTVQHQALCSP